MTSRRRRLKMILRRLILLRNSASRKLTIRLEMKRLRKHLQVLMTMLWYQWSSPRIQATLETIRETN
jgi:hypothetical protein